MNSTKSKSRPRPLSPHVQVYSWLITSTLSILHRLTGVALSAGLILFSIWLISMAYYPALLEEIALFLHSIYGKILMGAWSFAMFYHLCNGIRHLFWDMGKGFELQNVTRSGYAVLIASAALTAITWLVGLGHIQI